MEDREQNESPEAGKTDRKSRAKAVLRVAIVPLACICACALFGLGTYWNHEYHCWYGPFATEDVVNLPIGYRTHVTPLGRECSCWAIGDGRLTLIEVRNGFVLAHYRRGILSDSENECQDNTVTVMSLHDWNWTPEMIEYHLRTVREEDERRVAEHGFLQGWFVGP